LRPPALAPQLKRDPLGGSLRDSDYGSLVYPMRLSMALSSERNLMRSTIAVGVCFVLTAAAACGSSTSPPNLCANSGAAATASATDAIAFTPGSVTITHGQSVCWQNVGTVAHTVADNATNGSLFNSNLPAGQMFVHTFPSAGSFGYHCNIHSSMSGTITVN